MKKRGSLYIGLICALLIGASYLIGLFEATECRSLDFLFKVRGERRVNPNIVIIEIDDKSLEQFGRWPWTRGYHAALLDILGKYKPKTILFDVLFSERQTEHPEEDELLAFKSKEIGNVFYAAFFDLEEDKSSYRKSLKAVRATLPLSELVESAEGLGFVNILVEPDGKVRRVPLFIQHENAAYASIDILAAADYLDKDVSTLNIKTDQYGMLWINYAAKFNRFNRISFSDIAISYDQIKKGEKPKIDLNVLKDKIILIGLTATGSEDFWVTSMSTLYPGIGIRANIINTILERDYIYRVPGWVIFIFLLILGIALGVVVPKLSPLKGLPLFLILGFSLTSVAIALFAFLNIWMALSAPLFLLFITYPAITLNLFVITRFEKGLIEKELQIASRIQQSILPQKLPHIKGIEFGVKCVPAKHVGGDFYDFIRLLYDFLELKEDKLGIVIADVSGKGVPAALFMAKVMSDFRSLSHNSETPGEALTAINERLIEEGSTGMFVTIQYLIYRPKEKVVEYSNGGHNPLVWVEKNGEAKLLTQDVGSPIGIIPGSEFKTDKLPITGGEVLVMYTDGISEARNNNRKEFGEKRILECVKNNREISAQELAEKLVGETVSFSNGAPQHDDMTVIVFKISDQ